jgi:hypothetical protein
MALTYNIQQFAPAFPNLGNDLLNTFVAGRNNKILQEQQTEIDRQKAMAIYEAQAAAQAKAQAEAEDRAYMSGLFMKAHENPTWENRSLLINEQARRDPAGAKAIIDGYAALDEATQQATLRDASNILTAYDTDPEAGNALLEKYAKAAENSGNKADAEGYRDMLARAKASPQGILAVKDFYTRVIGAIDPEALKAVSEVGEENRKRASAPAELRKTLAEAGLSEAKINETLANTARLEAETRKLLVDLEAKKAQGIYDPKDAAEAENSLRKEFDGKQKTFQQVKNYYDIIENAETTGIGDVALIFTYMKILDPTSVVREGEVATASNAGGIPSSIMSAYNKALGTGKIDDKVRNEIKSQSKKIVETAGKQVEKDKSFYTDIATRRGLNVENIIYAEPVSTQPTTATSQTSNVVGAPAGVGQAVPGGGIDEAGFRAYIEANSNDADKAEAREIKDFNELQRVFSKSARAYAATLQKPKEVITYDFNQGGN